MIPRREPLQRRSLEKLHSQCFSREAICRPGAK